MATGTESIRNIASTIVQSKRIYIIGNGGSASQADHLACDLLKNCRVPAISLCNNSALITAIANDYGYPSVFRRQLEVLMDRDTDTLIIFTTRGNSINLVEAARWVCANPSGTHRIIGVFGYDGGELMKMTSIHYLINSEDMQFVEDEMAKVSHEIYRSVLRLVKRYVV